MKELQDLDTKSRLQVVMIMIRSWADGTSLEMNMLRIRQLIAQFVRMEEGVPVRQFSVGQLVAYVPRTAMGQFYKVEIGKIKRLGDGMAWVYYHEGSTTAGTNLEDLLPITNDYVIKETSFCYADKENTNAKE